MKIITILAFIFSTLCACSDPVAVAPISATKKKYDLLDFNRDYISYESKAIDTLLAIKDWDFDKTKTGLRFNIDPKDCSGYKPNTGDVVRLSYQVNDIHDHMFYDIKDTVIHVEKDYTVNGLIEGVKMMCKGTEGTFVMPSYLAYDIKGDKKKIGPREVLIYRVKINNVIKNTKND